MTISLQFGNRHTTKLIRWIIPCALVTFGLANHPAALLPRQLARASYRLPVLERHPTLLDLRGGASPSSSSSKKKKQAKSLERIKSDSKADGTTKGKKKKKDIAGGATITRKDRTSKGKKVIEEAMEKDPAEALGDAIRSRGDELRTENPLLDRIDRSVSSVGWALGASDDPQSWMGDDHGGDAEDDGGIAGSPTSVLANYFLQSHGGAHALQCVCGLLAGSAGLASLLVPAHNPLQRVLLRRALLFAMTKHVAGLLGAALLAAKAIPKVGLRKARVWMEQLAVDPVSQYVFYSACVLLWLPDGADVPLTFAGDVPWISAVLVGPILLREVVSTMWVVSDVLVLWATSNNDDDGNAAIHSFLQSAQQAINVLMSLLVTPERWRGADPALRQRILAKLTSKVSLALELVTGAVMVLDAMVQMGRIVFGNSPGVVRPPFALVIKRLLCSRIYLQYLLTRKRKIGKLATDLRGGSAQLPLYVLDILMDPRAALGLPEPPTVPGPTRDGGVGKLTRKDYVMIALGLDE